MKVILKNRTLSANLPKGYIPKDGEVWEAVNKDTGEEALVMVKKDGPQSGGCSGCIADQDRWNSCECTHISCGKYYFKLIDINDIMENL